MYLGNDGCLWQVKPIICEMFLCDPALENVLQDRPDLQKQWEAFKAREKDFKWPDKPVLFDELEEIFLNAGLSTPRMYLHNSPGLLRIKKLSRKNE